MQQRQPAGAKLLGAIVGIVPHIHIEGADVDCGERCQLQGRTVHLPGSALLQTEVLHRRNGRVRIPDFQSDGFGCLVGSAGGTHLDVRDPLGIGCDQRELQQLVSLSGEADALGAAIGERAVGFHFHRHLANAVFHREHIHSGGYLLPASHHPGKGGDKHQRALHRNGLLCISIGTIITGNHHHTHASHIHREAYLDGVSALAYGSGALEEHHRIEAVVLTGVADRILITADGGHRRHFAAECAYHLVVKVPGAHGEGLVLIHGAPWIRGLEGRQVQQALIHYGKGVGHRLAVALRNLHGEGLFRMDHVRQAYHGFQVRGGIIHLYPLHSVEAYGKIVGR